MGPCTGCSVYSITTYRVDEVFHRLFLRYDQELISKCLSLEASEE